MFLTYLKNKNKSCLSEAVIQDVSAVRERRLSLRAAASKYGMAHAALLYRILKNQQWWRLQSVQRV